MKYRLLYTKDNSPGIKTIFESLEDFLIEEGDVDEKDFDALMTKIKYEMTKNRSKSPMFVAHIYNDEGALLRSFDPEYFEEEGDILPYSTMLDVVPMMTAEEVEEFRKIGVDA